MVPVTAHARAGRRASVTGHAMLPYRHHDVLRPATAADAFVAALALHRSVLAAVREWHAAQPAGEEHRRGDGEPAADWMDVVAERALGLDDVLRVDDAALVRSRLGASGRQNPPDLLGRLAGEVRAPAAVGGDESV